MRVRSSARPPFLGRVVAAVLLAVVASACVPLPPIATHTGPPAYARAYTLGDSFTAGVGAPGLTGPCLRSPYSWANQLVGRVGAKQFVQHACAGATMTELATQVSRLPATPSSARTLVMLTIGGNDVDFTGALIGCIARDCTDSLLSSLPTRLARLDGLDGWLVAITARLGPNTRVVVAGYPRPFGSNRSGTGTGCSAIPDVSKSALDAGANALAQKLAGEVAQARAAGADVRFADVRAHFGLHGACSSAAWLNAPFSIGLGLHPDATGYVAMADVADRHVR